MDSYQPLPQTDRGVIFLRVQWVLFAVATLLVGCRVAVRISKKTHGWDDFFIYLAWLIGLSTSLIYHFDVSYGYGQHLVNLYPYPDRLRKILLLSQLEAIQSPLGITFVKISVIIFVLRLIKKAPKLRYIAYLCYVNLVIFVPVSVAAFLIQCLKCRPLSLVWTLPNPSAGPTCISAEVQSNANLVQAIMSAISDVLTAILPVLVLQGLQISKKKKIGLCVITGLGILTSGFAVARAATSQEVFKSTDPTYSYIIIAILSTVELLAGIIVACLPVTVPIFLWIKKTVGASISHGSQSHGKPQSAGPWLGPKSNGYIRKEVKQSVSSISIESSTNVPLMSQREQYFPGYTAPPGNSSNESPPAQDSHTTLYNKQSRVPATAQRSADAHQASNPSESEMSGLIAVPPYPARVHQDTHGQKMGSWLQTEDV